MNFSVSYNWLKEFLPRLERVKAGVRIDLPVNDFVKEFSLKSQTIDQVRELGKGLDKVVVGKLIEVEKHPDADKLHLAKVDIGKKTPLKLIFGQVVKLKVGDQLPVAVAPAKLPTGIQVKKAKIRGINSEGMFCLNSELGLSEYDEVTFFDSKVKPGTPIAEALNLTDDYLLDIEVTSNRPDVMSVVGLAREAAAALGVKDKIKIPKPKLEIKGEEIPLSVEVEEPKLCPRYNAVVMTDVKVGPSPLWLQMRLIAAGMRPINNLVDITNYLILEHGRPMHVFDYKRIKDQKIIVRQAKQNEKILALDGETYKLSQDHLAIADAKAPIAIGGVMGGELSAAVGKTKTIVFECAAFDPVLIRKTARELNLHSDSSDLFEKGLHPETTFVGMLRAIELTQKIAGGKVASPIIDVYAQDYKPNKIKFDIASIKRHLGIEIPVEEVKKILESLGFEVTGARILNVTVPYWRALDVEFEHDLIEEVARIFGYHNLPTSLPQGEIPVQTKEPVLFWEDKVKDILVSLGFTESYNYSFVSKDLLQKVKFPVKEALKIYNPLNEEMEYMRTTLIGQVLQNVAGNVKSFPQQKIFELSSVYLPTKEDKLPDELPKLTGVVVGSQDIFLQTKGVVEFLLKELGISGYKLELTDPKCPLWEKGHCLDIYKGKKFLGQFGLVKQNILEKFNIKQSVCLFDFDFQVLAKLATTIKTFQSIPEFPSVTRDLAIVVDQKLSWQEVSQIVNKADRLIVKVEYLSTFSDSTLGKGKKSLALRMVFRSSDRTLKSEEVDQVVNKVIKKLDKSFEAKLR